MKTDWPTKKVGDVLEKIPQIRGIKTNLYHKEGQYPIIDQGQSFIAGYSDNATAAYKGRLPVVVFGDHTRAIKFLEYPFILGADGTKILLPNKEFDGKFFYFSLLNLNIKTRGYARHYKLLREKEIPLPPLEIQNKIVKKIEELFAKIDQAQSLRKSSVQDAKNLISSAINQIFIQSKTDHWPEKTLPEISNNVDSKRRPITKSQRKSGPYPYYGASGIVDQVADYIFDEELLLISEDGANLLARSTPIAFSVSGKIWVNNHAHVLRFENLETQKLVEYLINNIDLKPYVSGSAQPKLNQAKMNSIKIPLPPIAEQKKIVERLDALTQKVRELQKLQSETAANLTALKQSILHKAFQGEL